MHLLRLAPRRRTIRTVLGLSLALGSLSACGQAAVGQAAATPTVAAPTITVPLGDSPTPAPATVAPPTVTLTQTLVPLVPTPPANPLDVFNPLNFSNPNAGTEIVKTDLLDLDGKAPLDALITVNVPPVLTTTDYISPANLSLTDTHAALLVAGWDAVAVQWHLRYHTPDPGVPGRAVPLPSGVQGRNWLGTTPPTPILQLRTESAPAAGGSLPTTTLYLYRWQGNTVQPLPMRAAGATADSDAVFSGSGDVQLLDLDNDGHAEVVVDDGAQTHVWKWDGNRFVPRP